MELGDFLIGEEKAEASDGRKAVARMVTPTSGPEDVDDDASSGGELERELPGWAPGVEEEEGRRALGGVVGVGLEEEEEEEAIRFAMLYILNGRKEFGISEFQW